MEAFIERLHLFPFKSLPGIEVQAATLTERGGLRTDREFAFFDETGYVNGKREPLVHALRIAYALADDGQTPLGATFASPRLGDRYAFAFEDDPRDLEPWLERHFGRPVHVRRDVGGGFPDDGDAPGPTVIARATLDEIAGWFADLDTASVRERLRTNVEIGGVPAFWEDRLYAQAGTVVPFTLGEVALAGTNPCQRCVVPTRDPLTGVALAGFAKRVAQLRERTLPAWAERSRFNHFYRLAVNTRPVSPQTGRRIRVGDPVTLAVAETPDEREPIAPATC